MNRQPKLSDLSVVVHEDCPPDMQTGTVATFQPGTYVPATAENIQRLKDAGFRVVTLTHPDGEEYLLEMLHLDGSPIPPEELFAVLTQEATPVS